MAVYRTTFPVAASAERVWEVLADFASWPEWNPSIPSISGIHSEASEVSLTLAMPGRPSAKVRATLTEVEPGRRLSWEGNVAADWFFFGRREFDLAAQPDGTVHVTHVEDVRGMFFPVFRLLMGSAIDKHHEGLNVALRQRAETP